MGITTYKTINGNFVIDSKKLNEKVTEVYKTYGFDLNLYEFEDEVDKVFYLRYAVAKLKEELVGKKNKSDKEILAENWYDNMNEKFGLGWNKENAWCKYISEKYIIAEITKNGLEIPEVYFDTKVEALMEFLKMGALDNLKVFRGTVVCKDICGEEVLISIKKQDEYVFPPFREGF
ncbi:hypothetical protein [Clostridium sp.]|uniref:hypothetical protein n=1 Tax=Clostridium sp. TaxID=1506 RepID=UPI00262872DE|nr:hypothetical protein [Clostridium sp.]